MYCWADRIHFNIRLGEQGGCAAWCVGVRADGTKELVAVADGTRESTDDWAELLRDCAAAMGAPVVMVGDGALGLWRALRKSSPWVHKVANVLTALPKTRRGRARPERDRPGRGPRPAERAIQALVSDYGAKWPKAVAKVADDHEALLTFFDYPAEHWLHHANPIEHLLAGEGQNQG